MKNLYRLLPILIIIGVGINMVSAQSRYFDERAVYGHQIIAPYLVNPGAIGANEHSEVMVNYRNKWSDFDGSPSTITFAYAGPVGNRLSLGAQLMRDKFGVLESSKGEFGLAYTIDSEVNRVSFGISTSYVQHRASGDFGTTNLDDPVLIRRLDGDQYFEASFGIFGRYNDALSYGISLPSLVSSRINNDSALEEYEPGFGYIINLGYDFATSDGQIKLMPAIFIKSLNNVPTHVDLAMRLSFLDDRFTGGLTYKLGQDNTLGFLIGTRVDALNLFYSYNITNQQFQSYNNGVHELTLRVDIGRE